MGQVNLHNNFFFFTGALVFLLLTSALVSSTPDGDSHWILQGVLLMTELVAFFTLNLSKHWRRFVIFMLIAMFVANIMREFTSWSIAPLTALIVSLIFYCGMAYTAAKQVLFSGCIELNTIVGTVAVYLLLGLIWSILYLLAMEFWPGAFNGIEYKDWRDNFGRAIYFSYVTMTSLGYGDISPAIPVTQTLAFLQAVCGTFYMAVVVASLIGAHGNSSK